MAAHLLQLKKGELRHSERLTISKFFVLACFRDLTLDEYPVSSDLHNQSSLSPVFWSFCVYFFST